MSFAKKTLKLLPSIEALFVRCVMKKLLVPMMVLGMSLAATFAACGNGEDSGKNGQNGNAQDSKAQNNKDQNNNGQNGKEQNGKDAASDVNSGDEYCAGKADGAACGEQISWCFCYQENSYQADERMCQVFPCDAECDGKNAGESCDGEKVCDPNGSCIELTPYAG